MTAVSSFERRYLSKRRGGSASVALREPLALRVAAEENAVTLSPIKVTELLGLANTNAPSYKTLHVTPTVCLDPAEIARCFKQLTTGVPYACFQRLNAELMRAELVMSSATADLSPRAEMKSYVENVLRQLQQDALRAILAIGVVPIAFRRDDVTRQIIPYVPEPLTYTVAIGTVRGVQILEFRWLQPYNSRGVPIRERQRGKRGNDPNDRLVSSRRLGDALFGIPDPSVVVLGGFNHNPSADGCICSVVSSFLASAMARAERFTNCATVAEVVNALPPIVRQYNAKPDEARHEALRGSEYVGEGVLDVLSEGEARRINAAFLRTNRQVDAYQRQNREAERTLATLTGRPIDDDNEVVSGQPIVRSGFSGDATDADGNMMPWKNEFVLPENYVPAHYQLPQPRHDLVPLLTHFNEQVFFSFLIPAQVLNANATLRADADSADRTLDVAVGIWKQHIARVLTFGHDATFMSEDAETAIAATIKRNRGRLPPGHEPSRDDDLRLLVSDEELNEIVENVATVRITYGSKPLATQETLDRLLARGVIGWETFTATSAEISGISPDVTLPTDKLDVEARRVIGLPNYSAYLQWRLDSERETARQKEAKTGLEIQQQQTDIQETVAEQPAEPPAKKKRAAKKK